MQFTHKLARRLALLRRAILLATCAVVAACDSDRGGLSPSDAESPDLGWGRWKNKDDTTATTVPSRFITTVSVSPDTTLLAPGTKQVFTAKARLRDSSTVNLVVTWAAIGGQIDSTGLYTAPAAAGAYRVVARAQNGMADTASVSVQATPTTLTVQQVVLTPATVSLQAGSTQAFTASAIMSDGSRAPATVTYTATGGTISPAGLYTAGQTAGTFRVIAVGVGGKADTSAVTITAPAPTLAEVVLTPATVTLQSGATQQFTAAGKMSDGTTGPVVATYTATGGTVTSSGLYTAGQTAGTYRVIAAARGKADTSAVTVTVPISTTGTQARMADLAVEAVGVNTHLHYSGHPYYTQYSTMVKPRLQELGVRYIRDNIVRRSDGHYATMVSRLKDLHSTLGIKASMIADTGKSFHPPTADVRQFILDVGPAAFHQIEGPNEPDLRYPTGSAEAYLSWMPQMRRFMENLWNAVNGNATTAVVPVTSPSFIHCGATGETPSYLGYVGDWVDYANYHLYHEPNRPTSNSDRVNTCWKARFASNYKPGTVWTNTEMGYPAAPLSGASKAVTEIQQAKYLPRAIFVNGFSYGLRLPVFIYEFVASSSSATSAQAGYGIVRYDGTVRPAFTALKNLIALMKDPGGAFTPGRLNYSLSGSTSNVRHLLFQKRDGRFYLVVWCEIQSSDSPYSQAVTLTLGSPATATLHRPRQGTTQALGSGSSWSLNVPDEVVVIELAR